MKKIIISFLLTSSLILTGCSNTKEEKEIEKIDAETLKISFEEEDLIETFNKEESYIVEFNDKNVNYSKGKLNDSTYTITEKGTYYLTGNFNGNIEIDSKEKIRLIFDNITITSEKNSPIFIKNSEKTIITLATNSNNKLVDTSNYSLNSEDEPNSTLFSKDDLVINGTGTLEIESNYNDAIASKDGLKIANGNYKIVSVGDGIRGKDYVLIKNGNFDIKTENDGIKTTNTETELGNLIIEDGNFNIVSMADGLDSQNSISIKNGKFNIMTGGGSSNASTKNTWGKWNNYETNESSAKGIKATSNILIENAEVIINSSDDSIHSNNIIEIKNGNYEITSGDDGIHADTNLKIYDGNINIKQSYEGLESSDIYVYNGTIYINSTDDGINVAGGVDSSSMMGRPGQNHMSKETGKLEIDNGYIYVDAQGDGLDANGSIYLKNGFVIVNGPTNGGNGIFDYDYEFVITGGTLIGAGSSNMMQTPSSNSSINTISIVLESYNNYPINITDNNNNTIITFKPSKQYNSFIYTSSLLKTGEKYNININGEAIGNNKDGVFDGKYKGTLLENVTINNTVTTIGKVNNMGGNVMNNNRPHRR